MRVRAIGGIRPRPAGNSVFPLPVEGGVSRAVHVGVTSDSSFAAIGRCGFTIDRQGALVIAELDHIGNWNCSLCSPRFVVSPRLVSREVIANPPLEPATVGLANRYQRELWVLVADLRDPAKSARLKIPAGESKSIRLERDSGGQIVEVYAIPQPVGPPLIEEHAYPIPPRQL